MIPAIKFNHFYNKFEQVLSRCCRNQVILLDILMIGEMTPEFIAYDTGYQDDELDGEEYTRYYNLPSGPRMMLIFKVKQTQKIFTTIRRHDRDKFRFYEERIGEVFDVLWVGAKGAVREKYDRY